MPERGDVVIFRAPAGAGQNWIKRVIGLPGDRVAVRGGEVFVNGKKLERDRVPDSHLAALGKQVRGEVYAESLAGRRYLIQLGGGDEKAADFPEKTVPEGCYFLLGDNRDSSAGQSRVRLRRPRRHRRRGGLRLPAGGELESVRRPAAVSGPRTLLTVRPRLLPELHVSFPPAPGR